MNKKLTIGIALEPHLARLAQRAIAPIAHLPLRLHDTQTYHVPLCMLGWIPEDAVPDILDIVEGIVAESAPFDIVWRAIEGTYRTEEDRAQVLPQHIRILGEESLEARDLHNALEAGLLHRQRDVAHFAPRVDLAHVRRTYWEALPAPRPKVAVPFECTMDVMQVAVFEHTEIEGKKTFVPLALYDLGSSADFELV